MGQLNYVIKKGDSLSLIAKKNGLSVKQLLALNPQIKNANLIRVGQNISLGGQQQSQQSQQNHQSTQAKQAALVDHTGLPALPSSEVLGSVEHPVVPPEERARISDAFRKRGYMTDEELTQYGNFVDDDVLALPSTPPKGMLTPQEKYAKQIKDWMFVNAGRIPKDQLLQYKDVVGEDYINQLLDDNSPLMIKRNNLNYIDATPVKHEHSSGSSEINYNAPEYHQDRNIIIKRVLTPKE